MAWNLEFNTTTAPLYVPAFLLLPPWEDVSDSSDVCPRFVNRELGLSIWVDYDNEADREFGCGADDADFEWGKYTVMKIDEGGYIFELVEFFTESQEELCSYLAARGCLLG